MESVSSSPTHGLKTSPDTYWLDKALDGQTSEIKARVLEITMKFGIDPNDEFFILFIALGQLQALVEDTPNRLASFQGELNQWSTTNLKTLELLARKAKTTEELAEISKELMTCCTTLSMTLTKLIEQSTTSNQSWNGSEAVLMNLEKRWTKQLSSNCNTLESQITKSLQSLKKSTTENQSQTNQTIQSLHQTLQTLNERVNHMAEIATARHSSLPILFLSGLLLLLTVFSGGSFWMLWQSQPAIYEQSQR